MSLDRRTIDRANEAFWEIARRRTAWRISTRLGMDPHNGRYVRTWIGPQPVYLGRNRKWLPCQKWMFASPKNLCGR